MELNRKSLEAAVKEGILSQDQAERLYLFLEEAPSSGPRFDMTHVLYYLGGMIAIGAMTLFMNLGWEAFGGWGIFFISLCYAGIGLKLALSFERRGYPVPSAICATFVVALTPLAIYGLQQGMGWWPDESVYRDYHRYIRWHWLYLEFGTLMAGAAAAWRFRYPFLLMPIAATLWYMSMDIASMLVMGVADFELRSLVSTYFGLAMIGLAFWVDIRGFRSGDYAFWLYLFGVMTFWGGISMRHSDSELAKFIYCSINLMMILTGVVLVRRVFVVFGAMGVGGYLAHLANAVFKDSWLFPITLTAIGLGIIYLGILWQKNEQAVTAKIRSRLPGRLRELLEHKE